MVPKLTLPLFGGSGKTEGLATAAERQVRRAAALWGSAAVGSVRQRGFKGEKERGGEPEPRARVPPFC